MYSLPTLLPKTTVIGSTPNHHIFTSLILTGRSKSGKPILTPTTFSLHIASTDETTLEITTITDGQYEYAGIPAEITGKITLRPEPHGCTDLTMALNSGTNPDRSFFSDPRRSPLPDPHRSPLSDPRRSLLGFAKSPSRGGAGVAGPTAHLLTLLPTLHARFKRNDEIDSLNQADFERSLTTPPPITAKEDAIVTNAIAVDAVDGNDESATWQRITGTIKSSVE